MSETNEQPPLPMLWDRDRIKGFLESTLGHEKIRTPENAVRFARSAVFVIIYEYEAERQQAHLREQALAAQLDEARFEIATYELQLEAIRERLIDHPPVYDELDRWLYGGTGL